MSYLSFLRTRRMSLSLVALTSFLVLESSAVSFSPFDVCAVDLHGDDSLTFSLISSSNSSLEGDFPNNDLPNGWSRETLRTPAPCEMSRGERSISALTNCQLPTCNTPIEKLRIAFVFRDVSPSVPVCHLRCSNETFGRCAH